MIGEDQHAVEARADAARQDFAELDQEQRHQAAERREAIVHGVDGAAGRAGGDRGIERGHGDAEANFLAFHVAAGRIDAELRQERIACGLRPVGGGDGRRSG